MAISADNFVVVRVKATDASEIQATIRDWAPRGGRISPSQKRLQHKRIGRVLSRTPPDRVDESKASRRLACVVAVAPDSEPGSPRATWTPELGRAPGNEPQASRLSILSSGGPSGIRTQDRRIKSPLLYRTELKALLPLYGPVTAVFSFAPAWARSERAKRQIGHVDESLWFIRRGGWSTVANRSSGRYPPLMSHRLLPLLVSATVFSLGSVPDRQPESQYACTGGCRRGYCLGSLLLTGTNPSDHCEARRMMTAS